eukprot:g3701.t1
MLNLIDTPGHVDFAHEVNRSLRACTGGLLLIDSAQGVQAQTIQTYEAARSLNLKLIPVLTKIDLPNADPFKVIDQFTTYGLHDLNPDESILLSAKTGEGCHEVLPAIVEHIPPGPPQLLRDFGDGGIDSCSTESGEEEKKENRFLPVGSYCDKPLRALIIDSWFDQYRGVVCLVSIISGKMTPGCRIKSCIGNIDGLIQEVGILVPSQRKLDCGLLTGMMGYMCANIKSLKNVEVGDTLFNPIEDQHIISSSSSSLSPNDKHDTTTNPTTTSLGNKKMTVVEPLLSFKKARPMVFASVFPADGTEDDSSAGGSVGGANNSSSDFHGLSIAAEKLALNDPSVEITKEQSESLGMGLRIGFLGKLHLDIYMQRLRDEFSAEAIVTAPTVVYKADMIVKESISKKENLSSLDERTETIEIRSTSDYPMVGNNVNNAADSGGSTWGGRYSSVKCFYEPMVKLRIISPAEYIGPLMELLTERLGKQVSIEYTSTGTERVIMLYELPWQEVLGDLHDRIKSITSGYANYDYSEAGYAQVDLTKIDLRVNGKLCDSLSLLCRKEQVQKKAQALVEGLRKEIRRQQFDVAVQASIGSKVIAKALIKQYRKDVTAKLYGGDRTRKDKLLKKQKAGKKRMKRLGNVSVPQSAFLAVIKGI